MSSISRLTALLVVAFTGAAGGQDRRAPSIDDLLNLVQVSGAEISPDGSRVIYSRSALKKWSDNKRASTVWIANTDGSDHRPLLGSDKDRSPKWSPDGRAVAFLSTRDQAEDAKDAPGAQLWVMPMGGGEAAKLTALESAVRTFEWAGDSTRLFFIAEEPRSDEEKEIRVNAGDGVVVDEDGNGQGRARFSNLWTIGLADRNARPLTTGPQVVTDLAPSPDGRRVAYISRPNNRRNQQNLAEVHVVDADEGRPTRLTTNDAPETNVQWSPDGRQLSYLAASDRGWELAQQKLYVQPVDGGVARVVSVAYSGDIAEYFWQPSGRTLVLSGMSRGRGGVHELELATGRTRSIASADIALSLSSSTADGTRAAGIRSDPSSPPEVVVIDLPAGRITTVSDANPWFKQLVVAQMRPLTWQSKDGLAIEGLLWLPADHVPGTRLPLLLSIHGGPAGVWSTAFRGINHVYASLGWAVLEPNVRGSTSYGDAMLRGNLKDIGGGDYEDAMAGVDAAIAQGIADPQALAVRGWSYGGILGGWTLTQTTRFRAASLGAMVTDWASEYAMGFNHDVRLWYIGGTPWENPDGYRRHSSYTHIGNATTPTLLLHGERDETCTVGQSMMFYQGLKDRGIEARFIRFPREPHGFREPQHIRMRDAEEISWLMKHARGLDWKAPERKDEPTAGRATTSASR